MTPAKFTLLRLFCALRALQRFIGAQIAWWLPSPQAVASFGRKGAGSVDTRKEQCERAADYLETHPGCTLRELMTGADLGNASRVVTEMERTFGYRLRRQRDRATTTDGANCGSELRYTLEGRPAPSPEAASATQLTGCREEQCERAADYLESHPGCTLRELMTGADLGNASRVVTEMERTFGYRLRRQRDRATATDSANCRSVLRYTLEARPMPNRSNLEPR